RMSDGPFDGELGIGIADRAFGLWIVGSAHLVFDFRKITQHAEAVSEADGDEELLARLVVELQRVPLAKRRGIRTNVDRDVPNAAQHHAHQFGLAGFRLIVDAAQRAFHRAGVVVLYENRVDTRRRVGWCVVRLQEESPIITEHFWPDDFDSRELSVDYLHDDCVLLGRELRRFTREYWRFPGLH